MMPLNLQNTKLITFDCYGTLIDWQVGLERSLLKIAGVSGHPVAELVQDYVRIEAALEQRNYLPYADILRLGLQSLAAQHRFELAPGDETRFAQDIGNWEPFADTIGALKRLKSSHMLGILSNIDIDLFARTNHHLQVNFDLIVTAEDVRSYKPSHAHFLRAIEQSGLARDQVLHVAQSLFHDAVPAADLGFPFVWINRYNQVRPVDVPMLAEFPNLESFAEALLGSAD